MAADDGPATRPTDVDPREFVAAVAHDVRRRDAQTLLDLMADVTGQPPVMWGPAIVGFGTYHYRYASGREGDSPVVGFSPRKAATTVYVLTGFDGEAELLARLGPHTTGRACLYLKRLDAVDLDVLRELVARSYTATAG